MCTIRLCLWEGQLDKIRRKSAHLLELIDKKTDGGLLRQQRASGTPQRRGVTAFSARRVYSSWMFSEHSTFVPAIFPVIADDILGVKYIHLLKFQINLSRLATLGYLHSLCNQLVVTWNLQAQLNRLCMILRIGRVLISSWNCNSWFTFFCFSNFNKMFKGS